MTRNDLNDAYFEWMYQLVSDRRRAGYRRLLSYLHAVDFEYTIPLDGNRAEDGIELRYRFGHAFDYDAPMIASYLDDRPCSVLEMMVALAIRCEEHIMYDSEIGDRTGQWFWDMIDNLGLYSMTDSQFDLDYVEYVIERFHDHGYGRNGEGGLFTVQNPRKDLRTVEIWYQMNWYLDSIV